MAYLINCRVCNAKISSDANVCPYCGDTKIYESIKIENQKKAKEERKRKEYEKKLIQEERKRKIKEQKRIDAKKYFDNLPVKTRIERQEKEYSAISIFGFAIDVSIYDLSYKEAIIEIYKDSFKNKKIINYIIMVFDDYTMYYKYQYVSEAKFIQYGGKPLSKWEKFWF